MLISEIFQDRKYMRSLMMIALPLIIQQVITYSVNLIDTMMIGSFGDVPLSAVNLVNQFYLLFSMLIFGSISGGNVLNAQFWGKKEVRGIHRVMGIQFFVALIAEIGFLCVSQLFPYEILHLYSEDEAVISAGITYLRIISPVFILFPIGQIYSGTLRCTGNARIPMLISAVALGLNALLNYLLIFGKFGFPALGLPGAAIATVIARLVEAFLYIFITYTRRLPTASRPKDMISFDRPLVMLMLKKGAPVIVNEMIWGLGTNAYAAIYAGISTASIAAYSAVNPVDNIAQALFIGVGDACAVIIGNLLGAGSIEKAKRYAKYTLRLSLALVLLTGLLLFSLRAPILSLYNLSDEALSLAQKLMIVVAFTLWLRTSNYTIIIGILRPGGEALFCLIVEGAAMWFAGIPVARLLAVHFGLPVYWVYFGLVTEEAVKLVVFWIRYRSGKWAVNLVGNKTP